MSTLIPLSVWEYKACFCWKISIIYLQPSFTEKQQAYKPQFLAHSPSTSLHYGGYLVSAPCRFQTLLCRFCSEHQHAAVVHYMHVNYCITGAHVLLSSSLWNVLTEHPAAYTKIYCLRELHRVPHSFCFQALQQYPTEIWLTVLEVSSIRSLSHNTTKW